MWFNSPIVNFATILSGTQLPIRDEGSGLSGDVINKTAALLGPTSYSSPQAAIAELKANETAVDRINSYRAVAHLVQLQIVAEFSS
jgi:hypothetical protein